MSTKLYAHANMFRWFVLYRWRVLHCDGSIPGPLPLNCPTQRILNSCSALIKYRRVQTSLHRIIIRSERWCPNSQHITLCHNQVTESGVIKMCSPSQVPRYRSKWQDHVGTSVLRCRPLASYVPLCSDLSENVSCTAACIAGRQLHNQPLPVLRDSNCITSHFLHCCLYLWEGAEAIIDAFSATMVLFRDRSR